ncbi:hypothetical protein RhiirA4_458122, partial [Rhizophagus irregularis]
NSKTFTLNENATSYTPKGKENKQVLYVKVVKQDSNSDFSRPSSPSLIIDKKKKKTAFISKTSLFSTS